jgi:hypothetical protein
MAVPANTRQTYGAIAFKRCICTLGGFYRPLTFRREMLWQFLQILGKPMVL